ncbi:MAG TPA: putative glycoside hydrolase [Thermoguttaceae bacterium]|nr:putative glycoside hydrolase [Thermoguttaceae bacterium]
MNESKPRNEERILTLSSGISIHLVCEGERVLGIGRVRSGALELRAQDVLLAPVIQSEAGIAYREFRLKEIAASPDRVVVHLDAIGEPGEFLDVVDVFRNPHVVLPRPRTMRIVDPMQWIFEAATQDIDGVTFRGFRYQFLLTSATQQFTSLLERGTWELGELQHPVYVVAQRSSSMPYEIRVTEDAAYDTSEVFTCDGKDSLCWQMMTRYAGAPAFDFQFNSAACLLMYYERPTYVAALQQKVAGQRFIAHIDRHRFAASGTATHPKKLILLRQEPSGISLTEGRNRWSAAFDAVVKKLRDFFGYQQDAMDPCYSGVIWSWPPREPKKDSEIVAWLPKLEMAGVKTLFLGPMWVCDTSLKMGGSDIPMSGGQGNICCPWRYEIAPEFGGEAHLKKICDEAHRRGIRVLTWMGRWVDTDAPLCKEHPEWLLRTATGDIFNGGYPTFAVMCLNTPFKQWLLDQLLGTMKRTGLDGFFLDSYHNLFFQPINYADPAKTPQMEALIDLQVQLQRAGAKIMIETQGIFGISLNWFAPASMPFHRKGGLEGVYGQEYTLKNMHPCINSTWLTQGLIPDAFLYRATACGSPIRVETEHGYPEPIRFPDQAYAGMLGRVNREYNRVHTLMEKRRLLEDDLGVEWTNGSDDRKVLFAFADFPCATAGRVEDITSGRTFASVRVFSAERFHTYVVSPVST